MVLTLYSDKDELLSIPNIDSDKVERYGTQFLKLVRDARRRYEELQGEEGGGANDIVPDPNRTNVITLSDDEYADGDDLFVDNAPTLDRDERPTPIQFPSRLNSAVDDPFDGFDHVPARPADSKARKRNTTKWPRRKTAGSSASKARPAKARKKSGDRNTGKVSSQKSAQKVSQRAKTSRPAIEMMPV